MGNWGLRRNMVEWARMPSNRYINKNGVVMDIKWELDSDNGCGLAGNNWSNIFMGLEFPITYFEIIREGWKRVF